MLREDKKAGFAPGLLSIRYRFYASGGVRASNTISRFDFGALADRQEQEPVLCLEVPGTRRQYWWFRDRVYWDDEELSAEDVHALLMDREFRKQRKLERARTNMAQMRAEAVAGQRESIPREVKLRVWDRDEGRCSACGNDRLLQFDHVIPVAMGGSSSEQNLQLLCDECNRRKGASL